MKILIIGAGAAGITAAHILSEQKIDFEILEASSVHGGRLKKVDDFADFPIDLGAEWIHRSIKAKPPVLDTLLNGKNTDFDIFDYRPKKISQYKNGTLRNIPFLKFIIAAINDAKFIDSTWFDVFDRLVTPEIKAKIHYNTPVNKIDYSSKNIIVSTTTGKQFLADKVLVTVPIKILQENYIEFIPAFPVEKRAAINKEEMGDGIKIFIEFSNCFYPNVLAIGKLCSNPFKNDGGYYDATIGKNSTRNILGLFAHGAKAKKYTSLQNNDEIIKFVLKELDTIFNGQATKYYQKHIIQNWSAEPFIHGSYSMRKGSAKELFTPLEDKVFFAGEAMNISKHTIAVHGASESAYQALERMLKGN